MSKDSIWHRAYRLYVDGFREMGGTGRKLWILIALKLLVMFGVLKLFFFPNHTKREAERLNMERSEFVQYDLIDRGGIAVDDRPEQSPRE